MSVVLKDEEELILSDEDLNDEYLMVAFSNGFSKGTANVSPHDMKKLRPLLNYYAKKPHPFTACVRDNRKRFGPRTEAICAVVKDLIYHSTKWRNQRKGGKAHLSQDEVMEFVIHDPVPDTFLEWLHEISEEDIIEYARLSQGDDTGVLTDLSADGILAELALSGGVAEQDAGSDVIWKPILREGKWKVSPVGDNGITIVKSGRSNAKTMTVSMSEILDNFKSGAVEHVQVPLGHSPKTADNTGFVRDMRLVEKDGKWELQAGLEFTEPEIKEKVLNRTIANVSSGLLFNFIRKADAKKYRVVLDHVALTNRPWLDGLAPFGDDEVTETLYFSEEGIELGQPIWELRNVADCLRRAISYEPEQDEVDKLTEALNSVLSVLAANEQQQGTEPVEIGSPTETRPSSDSEYSAGYSSENKEEVNHMGSEDKKVEEKENDLAVKLGLSEDEIEARLNRYAELESEAKTRRIDDTVKNWEEAKKAPAVIKEARKILLADDGAVAVEFSEESGTRSSLSATQIVEKLVDAMPALNLAEEQVADKDATGDRPKGDTKDENDKAELSQDVRSLATSLYFDGKAQTEDQAIEMAKKQLGETDKA